MPSPPKGRTRRSRARGTVAYALGAVAVLALAVGAGCLSGARPGAIPATDPGTTTVSGTPTTHEPSTTVTPSATRTATTTEPATAVHGFPYDVTIRIVAEPVNGTSVPVEDVPSLSAANLTDRQRTLLVALVEDGSTERWKGTSDERPPERIRLIAAVAEELPPSPRDRDPSEVWRVGRGATGYVVYEGTTYRVAMLKIAP